MSCEDSFRAALRESGIEYPGPIYIDGKLHRIAADGDQSKNSWYVLYPGSPVAGAYGCWKRGLKGTWCERSGSLTQSEWQDVHQRWEEASAKLKAETAAQQRKARKVAERNLNRSRAALTLHYYLFRKRVKVFGNVREYGRSLVLPLRDKNDELHTLQFINSDGTKKFLSGGRVSGCFFTLADKTDGPLIVCEGYATGASIHRATDHAVICAMNSGNLLEVSKVARELWPQREIIVAADDDRFIDGNPGVTKATAAAKAIGAKLTVPQFKDLASNPTDFNDLATAEGLDAVREQIGSAQVPTEIDSENSAETGDVNHEEIIARLAALPVLQYERCRKGEAEKLGCRESVLNKLVEAKRPKNCESATANAPNKAEATEAKPLPEEKRPLVVEQPEKLMRFEQWQAVILNNFPAYARPAEICASVFAQLLLNDVANPFALVLVDVPSSGKTITLNFFDVPKLAYMTDNFTPASFVSHAANIKREDLAKVDMLPRIRYRTLIVRDLATIFGAKEDDLLKTMGVLTRTLDGEGLQVDSGVHGSRGYQGDYLFMLLAGTTPIPPRVFKVMGILGSRLFFLQLHSRKKSPSN